jgi:hypothetical protein
MSSTNPQHEPTMEEILASIRKIISEDQPEAGKPDAANAPPQPPPMNAVESAPAPVADVLDLTEEVQEDRSAAAVRAAVENDVVFENIESEPKAERAMDHNDLISDATRHAMGRALANLDGDMPEQQPAPNGGSLEAIFMRSVQDAFTPTLQEWVDAHQGEIMDNLKPLIRAWMDENLPPLIEAAVSKELGRMASARSRRR